jgi:serine/threonine protein kinase
MTNVALDFIHTTEGVSHRDVKCGNIFFDVVGGPPVLGDFGLVYAPEIDGPETAIGETLGPSRWRPPELRSGTSVPRFPMPSGWLSE